MDVNLTAPVQDSFELNLELCRPLPAPWMVHTTLQRLCALLSTPVHAAECVVGLNPEVFGLQQVELAGTVGTSRGLTHQAERSASGIGCTSCCWMAWPSQASPSVTASASAMAASLQSQGPVRVEASETLLAPACDLHPVCQLSFACAWWSCKTLTCSSLDLLDARQT